MDTTASTVLGSNNDPSTAPKNVAAKAIAEEAASVSPRAATPVEPLRDMGELDEVRIAAAVTIQRLFRCRNARKQFRAMLESVFTKFYDEASGQHYYHNTRTGETTWEKPKLLKGEEDVVVAGVYGGGGGAGQEATSSETVNEPSVANDGTQIEDASGEEDGDDDEGEGEDEGDEEDSAPEDEDEEARDEKDHDGAENQEQEERDEMGYTANERALVKHQFDHYDVDKSGSISAKELLKLMQTLGEQVTLPNIQEMIKQVDANGNGEVEFVEFLQILKRQQGKNQYSASLELALLFGPKELDNLKRQFMKLDLDGSGFIDENEIKELIKKLGRKAEEFDLKAMLLEVDADGSGSIGFNEFLQIVASMMKGNGDHKRSLFASLLDLGIAQGVLNELNDVMAASKTKIYEWWNSDLIAEQKRLDAKRERRRKQEEEKRMQLEKDRHVFAEHEAQLAAERAARLAVVPGLLMQVVFAGDELNYPVPGQFVRVHYTGIHEKTGQVFESTRKRGGALEFCVGAGHIIKGFDLALQRMSVGETTTVTMAPMLAYGVKGQPPKIPPNATLVFKIELITIKEKLHLAQDLGDGED